MLLKMRDHGGPRRVGVTFMVVVLAISLPATSQIAKRTCRNGSKISLEIGSKDSTIVFSYHLSNPELFAGAFVEAWDKPNRLYRKKVNLERTGQIEWTPDKDPPETPSDLIIEISDPVLHGNHTSYVLIGGLREEGGPSPRFSAQSFVFEVGTDPAELTIEGDVLSEVTPFLLMEQEGSETWIAREYLTGTLVDLRHTRVEIPSGYLDRPTVLKLEMLPHGLFELGGVVFPDFRAITVNVLPSDQFAQHRNTEGTVDLHAESGTSPTITSVSPYPVPLMGADDPPEMDLKISGENFREGQTIVANNGDLVANLKTEFTSAQELHAHLPREFWRHHRLSFNLVAAAASSICSAEVWEDEY